MWKKVFVKNKSEAEKEIKGGGASQKEKKEIVKKVKNPLKRNQRRLRKKSEKAKNYKVENLRKRKSIFEGKSKS